ncbi:unnamed protein product [Meloidogyne enterolobii]|uniref:Uncharacterized protein n=1 Tax=Meloidogyne enterolobii TaxID=390850 RepID=A0ACB1AJ94_MELEN
MKILFLFFILIYFTNDNGEASPIRSEMGSNISSRGRNENQVNREHPFYYQHEEPDSMNYIGDWTNQTNIPTYPSFEPNFGHESSTQNAEFENQNYFGNSPYQLESLSTYPTEVPLDNFDIFGYDLDQFSLSNCQHHTTSPPQPVRHEFVMEKDVTENHALGQTEQQKGDYTRGLFHQTTLTLSVDVQVTYTYLHMSFLVKNQI